MADLWDTCLTLMLEEYRALRAQMVPTVDRQFSVVYWGISSVTLFCTAFVGAFEKFVNSPVLFFLVAWLLLPAVATAFVGVWVRSIVQIRIIGSHLLLIEDRVSMVLEGIKRRRSKGGMEEDERLPIVMDWEHTLVRHSLLSTSVSANVVYSILSTFYVVVFILSGYFGQLLFWQGLDFPSRMGIGVVAAAAVIFWFTIRVHLKKYTLSSISIAESQGFVVPAASKHAN